MEVIDLLPFQFWLVLLVFGAGGVWAWRERRQAWGFPVLMVLGTVGAWYIADVFYNDYAGYRIMIGDQSLDSAWWQVLLFLIGFLAMAKPMHRMMNRRLLRGKSFVVRYIEAPRLERRDFQRKINQLAVGLFLAWVLLTVIAMVRVDGDVVGLFAPYAGRIARPWARGQIGGGFSALLSLAMYLQIFLLAGVGVITAIAQSPRIRLIALVICLLAFPTFIFDRTRNTMLVIVLPGVLTWVFLRLRGGLLLKLGIMAAVFAAVNFWFAVVLTNRSGMLFDIEAALSGENKLDGVHHEGLNMFEELAWIDSFITSGAYLPNGGERYFAELVNVVPRSLWKDKPTIGLDYAVARGQVASGPSGEVTATISTGMIGQGVTNFGRLFGPLAAALLMALWVALLARMDLLGKDPAWMLLYLCGMIVTFNLGRDISFIGLFPFFFGLGLISLIKSVQTSARSKLTVRASGERRRRGMGPGVLRVPVAPGGAGKQD
jgi:hypothetical protein